MRLIILLLFIPFLAFSQPGSVLLMNNATTDATGNFSYSLASEASFVTMQFKEGSHSLYLRIGQADAITSSTEYNLNTGTGLTISLWFRNGQTSGYPNMFSFGTAGLRVFLNASVRRIHLRDGNYAVGDAVTGTGAYSYDTWTHVVFIKYDDESGNSKIYVNGTDATTDSTMDAPIDYTNPLTIGNLSSSSTGSFGGYIDNFQYYPYALTDAQIDSLYDNGATDFVLGETSGPPPVGPDPVAGFQHHNPSDAFNIWWNYIAIHGFQHFVNTETQSPTFPEGIIATMGRGVNGYNIVDGSLNILFTDAELDSIADAGFKHIRIVAYGFPDGGSPGYVITSTTLTRLVTLIEKITTRGMVALLDYHSPAWLASPSTENYTKFINHWGQLAYYLQSFSPEEVVFELVNEPTGSISTSQWNSLLAQTVGRIRSYDQNRWIMVSPGYWAGIKGLPYLELPEDDRLILSIHYYFPYTFTHQGADWVALANDWYPSEWYPIQPFIDQVEDDFAPLITFASQYNIPVHIGEWGTYQETPLASRARYSNFLARYFESQGWSWAIWDFMQDFGIYADDAYIPEMYDALLVNPYPDILPHDSTIIYQSNFTSNTDGWGVFTGENLVTSTNATLSVSGGELVATVNTPGSSYNDVRIGHTVDLVQGKMYRLSYTIRSASNRGTLPQRLGTRFPWQELMNVGSSGYTNVVSMYYSNVTHYGAKITFDIGGSSAAFYVSNVTWEELTLTDPLEGFTIYNTWDFENQTLGNFTEAEIESYFTGSSAYIDAGHEDKLDIVTESINGNATNKALRLTYPAETYSQLYFWDYPLNSGSGYNEVYASMNIKYGKDDLTGWSSTQGGKNFGFKGYPWSAWTGEGGEPDTDEGFYVVPMFTGSGITTHYYYNHWPTGYGNNYGFPSYGTNDDYWIPGVWYNLTMRAKMNSTAASSDGILEIFLNGIPVYQYNNYRFYEDASLMGNLIDVIEFTHFFGGAADEYRVDEIAYTYWDDIVVWMPETPTVGLTSGTLDLPCPVTGEVYPYQTLITTEQTFTNSEYGGNYSEQVTEAWLIDAGAGNTVTLTINAMDLDNSTTVQNDMVKIYDGNVAGSTLIGRHGSAVSTNFPTVGNSCSSTGRYMYVIFESDRNGTQGSGFQMTVTFN